MLSDVCMATRLVGQYQRVGNNEGQTSCSDDRGRASTRRPWTGLASKDDLFSGYVSCILDDGFITIIMMTTPYPSASFLTWWLFSISDVVEINNVDCWWKTISGECMEHSAHLDIYTTSI